MIPGPELPLTLGVVDAMTQAGIRCFGPSQWCAQLEGSKAAKDIMQKAGVPLPPAAYSPNWKPPLFVEEKGAPIVIKADGLAAGKGVVVAQTKEEALEALDQIAGGVPGAAGSRVVIEEFLVGEEVSLLAFCDGKTALPLPSAQDHGARRFDGDTGPNTGGMGASQPGPDRARCGTGKDGRHRHPPDPRRNAPAGASFHRYPLCRPDDDQRRPESFEYNVRFETRNVSPC